MTRPAALALLVLGLAAGGAAAQGAPADSAPAPAQPAQGARADDVLVHPGDLIQVVIYREPELNGEFLVDSDGLVVLPLIGEQQVAGTGVRELRRRLVELYRVHLRNPSINIIPLRRVTVLGEVNRPGMYSIDPTVSLAGAIALAGGPSGTGTIEKIRIMRDGQVLRERVGAGETLTAAGVRSNDLIYVDRRSWFERNSTFVVSALLSLTGVVTSIIINSNR